MLRQEASEQTFCWLMPSLQKRRFLQEPLGWRLNDA